MRARFWNIAWVCLATAWTGLACSPSIEPRDGGDVPEGMVPYDCVEQSRPPEYQTCVVAASSGDAHRGTVSDQFALRMATSCADAASVWREVSIARMERDLALARCNVLYPLVCEVKTCNRPEYDYGWSDAMAYDSSWGADTTSTPDPTDGATEYSTTNVQEVGVDEADFIKNDGSMIYILADGGLQIIDAWPAEEAVNLSYTPIEGTPRKLFVHNQVAVVYSAIGADDPYSYYGNDCTYGYDCDFSGDGRDTKITVLDISDPFAPRVIRESTFEGSYINARRIDNNVYTVVHFPDPPVPSMQAMPAALGQYASRCSDDRFPFSDQQVDQLFEDLRQTHVAELNAMAFDDWLPNASDVRWLAPGDPLVDDQPLRTCDGVHITPSGDGRSMLSIVSFDLTRLDPLDVTSIVGRPGAVYGSQQALYIAERHYASEMSYWYQEIATDEASTIHKLQLSAQTPDTTYVGSGIVKGRVLNQFALSEYDGFLRVATTTGHLPSPDVHNTLSVLQESAGRLNVVGQLDQLAPGEDIRSVRFDGDRGFMVTFKKTDPLFAFDLSDPTQPQTLGELKIPGFSTYMHFMDRDHILSIGYDADDQGDFAWFTGIMLQVFDVSDLSNPTLLHKQIIGTRGTTSDAATDHLAFNYFAPRDLLAIPITVCEDSAGGGSYGTEMTFNGLMIYDVTVAGGFGYRGGIPHVLPTVDDYDSVGCSNWWTTSNSTVSRSIIMDDYAYSVAPDVIKISHLDALETPVATVPLMAQ